MKKVLAGLLLLLAVAGCDDENDPKTWVKRLDDPAQRTTAIKRLGDFFNDSMDNAGKNREDPKVKSLLDVSVEPLAKAYTAGGLDEKTRKDLMKLLGEMGDPRAAPAFAKAFKDFEPGKNDDDLKFAAQGTTRLATSGQLNDQPLIDALWDCFAKFQPSKNTKSINLVKDLQGAVKTVKNPSYAPKAVALLAAPVNNPKDPAENMDQLQFWQLTAVQLIGDLKFTGGVKPLVKVLMTPTKADLVFPVRNSLLKMPKDAEPELIQALKAQGDYATLAQAYPEKAYIPRIAEPLAYVSRPAGRDAVLEVLASADNDSNRTLLAVDLTHWPADAKTFAAYLGAYDKIAPNAVVALMGGGNAHAILAQAASNFFETSLTDWILRDAAAAKGEEADAMPPAAYPSAIKLMTSSQSNAVAGAVNKISGQAVEKDELKAAQTVLDKCKEDAACYLSVLDTQIPTAPQAAKFGHIKAAWMAGVYGKDATRNELVTRLEKIKDSNVRLAVLEAIDHLTPNGDAATADRLEKIVDSDTAAGTKVATDEIYRVALKLRSRLP